MRDRINAVLFILVAGVILSLSLAKLPAAAPGAPASGTYQFGHFFLYFLLAGALLLYFHETPRGRVEAVLAAGGFGLAIEIVQLLLPFRTFSPADIVVNFLGAALVLLDHESTAVRAIIRAEDRIIERYLL
ncbi:MAG: VanZ family protein [Candidatus Nanohaloarchaea archaeon]|nr:VanZ family protein [Candidatus Nanohaloarchaea archaeon]